MAKTKKELRTAASSKTGIPLDRIGAIEFELNMLRRQGVLVDLDITGTSLFTRQVSWSELGIWKDDKRKDRITRGQKFLIPAARVKELRTIVARMRQWLDKYSYSITGFKPWRWVGYNTWETWTEKWEELEMNFYKVKNEIIANYGIYQQELYDDFYGIGIQVFEDAQASGYEAVITETGEAFTNKEWFGEAVASKALQKLPSQERIEKELQAVFNTSIVFGGADLEADHLETLKLSTEVSKEYEQQKADARKLNLSADLLEKKLQTENMEQEALQIKISAMREAELEHARERLEDMTSPFEEIFSELRRRFAKDVEKMLTSIKKNGALRGKIAQQGQGLLEIFDLMAIHDDGELRDRLENLKTEIGTVGDDRKMDWKNHPERDLPKITGILEEIADLASDSASDLQKDPTRFNYLDM